MNEVNKIRSGQGREEIQNGNEMSKGRLEELPPEAKRNQEEEKDITDLRVKIEDGSNKLNSFIKEKAKNDGDVKKEEKPGGRRGLEGRRKSSEGGGGGGGSGGGLNVRRGSIGRPQIKIPYLAQIERRISMDLLDYSGKLEGLKLIRELNRETSHYRHLVVALGGSSDCEQLREDLKRSRERSGDLVRQAKLKILPCLQDPNRFSTSDRKEAKRLCKLLFYCIRVLEQELMRSLTLQSTFALNNQNLINTGVNEYFSSHYKGSPPAQGNDQAMKERFLSEKNDVLSLQKEAAELRSYLHKSDGSPSGVKSWTMEDFGEKQFLQTILEDSDPSSVSSPASPFPNPEANNEDLDSVHQQESFREKLHHRKCLCWIFATLIITLLLASLLGALISFLAS